MTKVCERCGKRFVVPVVPGASKAVNAMVGRRRQFCVPCRVEGDRARARRNNAAYRAAHRTSRTQIYLPRRVVARQPDPLLNVAPLVRAGLAKYERDPAAVEAACRATPDPSCRYDAPWASNVVNWQNGIRVPSARMGGGA